MMIHKSRFYSGGRTVIYFYSNWLNYYVYQEVPYEFINNREIIGK